MKRLKNLKTLLFILVLSITSIYSSCNEDDSMPNDPTDSNTYFPSAEGNYYKYSNSSVDSSGATSLGLRSSTYMGSITSAGTSYQKQIDSFFVSTSLNPIKVSNIGFRKDNGGIYYYLDTTGLSSFIPDTLKRYIDIPKEIKILDFPLETGKSFIAFEANLEYNFFIKYTFLDVTALYEGKQDITLNLETGSKTLSTNKIKYTMELNLFNPTNPTNPIKETFTAFGYVAENIGFVRWEGSSFLLNIFMGGGLDIDTSSTLTQSLINYNIK